MIRIFVKEAQEPQREVQRLLGRCMMGLQQYERLLKALMADHSLDGPVRDLAAIRNRTAERTARKTLGALVGDFCGTFLTTQFPSGDIDVKELSADVLPHVSFRAGIFMDQEAFEQTGRDLKELVDLRNMLVHHFLDRHDVTSVEGCQQAQVALRGAHDLIDAHLARLAAMVEAQAQARAVLLSDDILDRIIKGREPPETAD